MINDKKFEEHSTRNTEILIKVGLHISTILCANHNNTPAVPKNMKNTQTVIFELTKPFAKPIVEDY